MVEKARPFGRLPAVIECGFVGRQGNALIAGFGQHVGEFFPVAHVHQVDGHLVYAAPPNAVSHQVSIRGDGLELNRSGVVRTHGVGVEQDLVLTFETLAHPNDEQVLIGAAFGLAMWNGWAAVAELAGIVAVAVWQARR